MSPFALCQRATLAEVTDSPEAGTLTSVLMEMEGMNEWKNFSECEGLFEQCLVFAVVHGFRASGRAGGGFASGIDQIDA